jgi:hypothetical protein
MKMKQALAALVATSLVGAPVVAQAAAAESARIGSPVGDSEDMKGGWFVPTLAVIAVLLGILVLIDGGNDLPSSP